MPVNAPSVVLIGGGPRTAGLLERLAANRPELLAGALARSTSWSRTTPGSGRIWRYDQHPGLMLNSAAADVTMFTDASVQCEGPAAEGPGLAEWAAGVLDGSIADVPELPAELRRQLALPHRRHLPHPAAAECLPGMVLPPLRRRPRTGHHRHGAPGHGVRRRTRAGRSGQRDRRPERTASGWPAARCCTPTS